MLAGREISATLLLFLLGFPPLATAADAIYLTNGETVTGTIPLNDAQRRALAAIRGTPYYKFDSLQIHTDQGLLEFRREEVKHFSIEFRGPDGKSVAITVQLPPPPIKMPFELETKHYIIKTDTADFVCKNAGKAMEQLYSAFTGIFHPEEDEKRPKTEIIIFDKEDDFLKYARSLGADVQKGHLGFFRTGHEGRDTIAVFKRRTDEFNTLSTLYHEATHQFIMMVMGSTRLPPLWLNEGLAVYFETSVVRDGKLQIGVVPRNRLMLLQKHLRAGTYVPLAELIRRGRGNYDSLCYSQGWSLVYFFLHARNGAYRSRFDKYFKMLKDGKDIDESFYTCFTKDFDQLEAAWKQFFLELGVPEN